MSDATKLRPEDLTSEERAIVDEIAMNYIRNDYEPHGEYGAFAQAARQAEPIILARRALFGEPASEAKGELTTADRIAADLAAGTFRGVQPESAFPVGNCPTCGELVAPWNKHAKYEGGYTCQRPQPAPPEPAVIRQSTTDAGEPPQSETRTAGNAPPEPAATAEMPDEVDRACDLLEWSGNVNAAAALRDAWRNHAQPVAVGMTEELRLVLKVAEGHAERYESSGYRDAPESWRKAIAAVRAQAEGVKVEAQRPKLEKTRRALKCGQERLNIVFLSEETTTRWNNLFYEALAELDAAEGKRTAGEHMSELSGEPLPHYLRDARLTANGMRAAAEIARNFRPKSACTCGGYISFHNGVPAHQPGCLVGECLEIADEIDARADEISDRDKTLDQEAREAAEGFADSVDAETGRTICKGSYMNGYIAAATARDKEIEELKLACRGWERSAAESESVALACEGKIARQEPQIAALRSRVAELEGNAPRWARGLERNRLEKLGWLVAGGEMVWHRSPGDVEASWHCLMVPPIQLPEGE